MKQKEELAGIEILRFLCAFGILIWHYQHFFFIGEWNSSIGEALRPTLPLYQLLSFFYENGSLAVPFFWVISGFIFYWHYCESVRNGTVVFTDFLTRRFSRLYPLHFVTLVSVAVGQYVYYVSHQTTFIYQWNRPIWFISQLLFASNWFTRQPLTFNGPIWSVSIEILVYLSFFFVVRAFRQSAFSIICMTILFAGLFNFVQSFVNTQVFACGMYFFAGGAAQRYSSGRFSLIGAICVLAVVLYAVHAAVIPVNAASVLVLAVCSVIVFTRLGNTAFGASFRYFGFLGNATYASYLLHFPLQLLIVILVDAIGWRRDMFSRPGIFVGYLLVVIGSSLLVHRYFEMPLQKAIRAGAKRRHKLQQGPGWFSG